jgi:micrococcal nuclease
MSFKVILFTLILVFACFIPACMDESGSSDEAEVIQIVDGDTIIIEGGYHVRYIGIDTPEKDQPYYSEAKELNTKLVEGKTIRLEKDITDKDKFDRLLRYIYVDSTFINEEIVRQGYANIYPENTFPDNKYYDILENALNEAKAAKRGMWN